jgi:hypothetical protein
MKKSDKNWEHYLEDKALYDDLIEKQPELLSVEKPKNKNMKKQNNNGNGKNYIFQNCTVNINEEGTAIELLKSAEEHRIKRDEMLAKMVETAINIAIEKFKNTPSKTTKKGKNGSKSNG